MIALFCFCFSSRADTARQLSTDGGGASATATSGLRLHGVIGSRGIGGNSGVSSTGIVRLQSGPYPVQFPPALRNAVDSSWRLYSSAQPALPMLPAPQLIRPLNLSPLVTVWRLS